MVGPDFELEIGLGGLQERAVEGGAKHFGSELLGGFGDVFHRLLALRFAGHLPGQAGLEDEGAAANAARAERSWERASGGKTLRDEG